MRTCSRCHTQSPDAVTVCPKCQGDLRDVSTTAVALKKLRENPRVRSIRIAVPADACPICHEIQGTYSKETVPNLPMSGCSRPLGCCAFYEPLLDEIYP